MAAANALLEKARDGDATAQQKVIELTYKSTLLFLFSVTPYMYVLEVIELRQKYLEIEEYHATQNMESTSQDLKILCQLASSVPKSFMTKNVADRIAMGVNSMLARLVGKKALEIKLIDPSKYKFDPKMLLERLVQVFVSLQEGS